MGARGEATSASAGSGGGGFAHLHLHTEYSLLDGGNRIDRLMDRVKALGMSTVAITDHGNLFGAVAFYLAARERGIKPVLGVEAYVAPGARTDRTFTGVADGGYHLVLLAENREGWDNLVYLCSEAYLTGFYFKPRIDREILGARSAGLIAINGHLGSEIGEHLLAFERSKEAKHWERAVESARWHARAFADNGTGARFFIELQKHVPEQNSINGHLIRLAREEGLGLVCDNDAHFLTADDHDAHDTLVCISTGKNKSDPDRMVYTPELYVKSPAQMRGLMEEYGEAGEEALANAERIAGRCEVELRIGANHAPMVRVRVRTDIPEPGTEEERFGGDLTAWFKAFCARYEVEPFAISAEAGETERARVLAEAKEECDAALRALAKAGVTWRYGAGAGGKDVASRLERELGILCEKGIAAYFLIVWDFVNWGRQQGIPALARGSGVGTMVGYVLGLSNACPVKYGLLFERFTDPDRKEYPDIDIDLCQDGRGRVIEYVRSKYGHVAQIITFGTMKARAAVRDVSRVLGVSLPVADRVAKLVPEQLNITLDEALEKEPALKGFYDGDPRALEKVNEKLGEEQRIDAGTARRLVDNARRLEGQARHASVHAAGVIVATRPLHEIVPLYRQPGAGVNEIVTQWDGPTCEKLGLLKMDFLGLRTLSVIQRCLGLIREGLSEEEVWRAVGRGAEFGAGAGSDRRTHPLDLDRLGFDDQRVFEMFRRGDTTGVFQFESPGMRRLLTEMKPDRLEDLIAANALFRPGPMDLIPTYNRRKHGEDAVPRVHPLVDRYTQETYGVMVYQEQVMQICHSLGGMPLRGAYSLIKAISKKQQKKIDAERPAFVNGAEKQGLSRAKAEELFELILKFAGYGFNKSHSTGYAIVAYQTAYLKSYFPNQYMAAFLSYESGAMQAADWTPYLEDCRRTRFTDAQTGEIVKVGVEVRPADINLSAADFSVVFEEGEERKATSGHVRFGLKGIKGVGDKAIEAIIRCRSGRKAGAKESGAGVGGASGGESGSKAYGSLHEFCERVLSESAASAVNASSGGSPGTNGSGGASGSGSGGAVINKATVEALIKAGAFDTVHGRSRRAAMVATIETAMAAGSKAAADKAAGQGSLFGGGGGAGGWMAAGATKSGGGNPIAKLGGGAGKGAVASGAGKDEGDGLARAEEWSEAQTLAAEKEALGFYVSSHPLDRWKAWCAALGAIGTAGAKSGAQDQRVVVAALVQSVRTLVVKTGRSAGQKMGVVTLEDLEGTLEGVLFADAYRSFEHLLKEDEAVFVIGRADHTRGQPQVMVDRVLPIDVPPVQTVERVVVRLDEEKLNGAGESAVRAAAQLLRERAKKDRDESKAGNGGSGNGTAMRGMMSGGKAALVECSVRTADGVEARVMTDQSWRVRAEPELVKGLTELLGAGSVRLVGKALESERNERGWSRGGGGGGWNGGGGGGGRGG